MVCRYVLDTTDRGKGPGVLGQGTFGKVYLVTDTQTNNKYALKTAQRGVCADTMITALESDIHMRLQHPYLVNGVDIFRPSDVDTCGLPLDDVQQGVLIPLMDYDLYDIQKDDKNNPKYPAFNALRASWQLACALEALYAAGYTHFDIKTSNILQKGDDTHLADYGLSYSTSTPALTRGLFTLTYRPPYVLQGVPFKSKDYMAADLYSLGLVFLDITVRSGFRPDWRSYSENDYVRLLAKEANSEVEHMIKYINDNRALPDILTTRQRRWNLPVQSLDDIVEYLNIVKAMITPTPTALTATQVRLRLEALWPTHPPAPTLRMVANPPVDEPLRSAATRVASYIVRVRNNRRVVPHIVELFLAVSKFATPAGHIAEGLDGGHRSWRLPFLFACHNIVVTFYSGSDKELLYTGLPYDPANAALYDDTFQGITVPYRTAVCDALKQITYAKELGGRYNFVLPGERSEFVPPGASVAAPAPGPVRPRRGALRTATVVGAVATGATQATRAQPTALAAYTAFRATRYKELKNLYPNDLALVRAKLAEEWKAIKAGPSQAGAAGPSQAGAAGPSQAGAAGPSQATRAQPAALAAYQAFRARRYPELLRQYPTAAEARAKLAEEWKAQKTAGA